ncbi:MAG: DUF3108 domain-containing protein [Candidatus Marinimicrobia bacterium]|nr:DUF3108 domain-containing protein [Candidatus Neomarinimicrobiota bacterium]
MRRILLWAAVGVGLVGWAAPGARGEPAAPPLPAPEKTEPAPELPFPVGELLTYRIYWGVLPVGAAEVTTAWDELDGRRVLAIRSRARTNRVLRQLYPVDDRIETLVDPQTLLPLRFTKQLKEGRYETHEVTTFDHAARQAQWHHVLRDNPKTMEIDADTRDLLSFMFHLRDREFTPGAEEAYRVMADDKMYDLVLDVQKHERVRTADRARVSAVRIEPKATFEGLFVRKGRMWLWLSRTQPTVILRAEVEVPVARVKLVLDPEASVDAQGRDE